MFACLGFFLPLFFQLVQFFVQFLADRFRSNLQLNRHKVSGEQGDDGPHQQQRGDTDKEEQSQDPEKLRDHQGRSQSGHGSGTHGPGIIEDPKGHVRQERHENVEDTKSNDVENRADPRGQRRIYGIDTHVGSFEQGKTEGKGRTDGQREPG